MHRIVYVTSVYVRFVLLVMILWGSNCLSFGTGMKSSTEISFVSRAGAEELIPFDATMAWLVAQPAFVSMKIFDITVQLRIKKCSERTSKSFFGIQKEFSFALKLTIGMDCSVIRRRSKKNFTCYIFNQILKKKNIRLAFRVNTWLIGTFALSLFQLIFVVKVVN